jgi:hypothetical protein
MLHLGIAYLRGLRSSDAKSTLSAVSGVDGSKDWAQMWLILSAGP